MRNRRDREGRVRGAPNAHRWSTLRRTSSSFLSRSGSKERLIEPRDTILTTTGRTTTTTLPSVRYGSATAPTRYFAPRDTLTYDLYFCGNA